MKRVLLCIMDGWGINTDGSKDATKVANTPNIDRFYKEEKNIYGIWGIDGRNRNICNI